MANKNSPLKDFHHLSTKEEKLAFQKAVEAIYQQKGKLPEAWDILTKNNQNYIYRSNQLRRVEVVYCITCDRVFGSQNFSTGKTKFCCYECFSQSNKHKIKKSCAWCKSEIYKKPSHLLNSRSGLFFCDKNCKNSAAKLEGIKEIHPQHYWDKKTEHEKNLDRRICDFLKKTSNFKKEDVLGDFCHIHFKKCKKCPTMITSNNNFEQYCSNCTYNSRRIYRGTCLFKFKQKDHPHLFNTELIKKYGWYQPTNTKSGQPNLNGLSWDHLFRVEEGFKLGISPEIMSHPANAELIPHSINQKRRKSMITYDELLLRIEKYEKGDYHLEYFFKDKNEDI